jgi:hypothetical protein
MVRELTVCKRDEFAPAINSGEDRAKNTLAPLDATPLPRQAIVNPGIVAPRIEALLNGVVPEPLDIGSAFLALLRREVIALIDQESRPVTFEVDFLDDLVVIPLGVDEHEIKRFQRVFSTK